MFYKVEKILLSPTYKTLVENFLSLSFLQVANYILPLITLPYLVRVLEPEKYGLIAFAQVFIGYFMILTDYGFNFSATREISVYRGNKERVSEIFSSVMVIKLFLFLLSLSVMSAIIFTFEKFRQEWAVYYLTFGTVLGQVLFPVYFFQGMEKMKYITILNVLAKLIFTIATFIFVKKASDYLYVPLLKSLGFIVAGLLSLWIVFRVFKVSFKLPNWRNINREFKNGWYIFISSINTGFYRNNSTLILGLFANNEIVGYFTIAKKLIDTFNQIAKIIFQSIYPYVSREIAVNYQGAVRFLRKIGFLIGIYTFFCGVIFFVFTDKIIYLASGRYLSVSILSLKLMAFVPMFIGISVPATQILLNKGLSRRIFIVVFTGTIVNIILNFLLVPYFSYIGSCMTDIIVEVFIVVRLYFEVLKAGKENK
jgi:polysaccharide transporter, PST family